MTSRKWCSKGETKLPQENRVLMDLRCKGILRSDFYRVRSLHHNRKYHTSALVSQLKSCRNSTSSEENVELDATNVVVIQYGKKIPKTKANREDDLNQKN